MLGKLKVAFINTLYPPYQVGGAERSLQVLAEGLVSKNLEPIVVTLHPMGQETVDIINGVKVYRVPLANFYWPFRYDVSRPRLHWRVAWQLRDIHNPVMAKRIQKVLLPERPDLVHTHNLTGISVSAWSVAVKMGLPIVHTVRDYSLLCPHAMYKNGDNCRQLCTMCSVYALWRRHLSQYVAAVVGVSHFILDMYIRMGFFSSARRVVIHNAVTHQLRGSYVKNSSRLRIGYLGRLEQQKGLEDVIEVLNNGCDLRDNVELVVGGRGSREYEQRLRAKAANLHVRWLGFVRPEELLSQIDVLVVPSRWNEPFGRVIIEAYANAKPVIAARRGGISEIVDEGRTGWLYDPDKREELESIIRLAIRQRALLAMMARHATEKAKEFEAERHVNAYVHVYQEVIRANGRSMSSRW